MAFTPTPGSGAIMTVTMTGGTLQTVPGVNWKLDLDGKPADTSNFRDGRAKAITLPDATLTATLIWDAAEQPTKIVDSNLRLGSTGVAKCYTDATHFFSVAVILTNMGPENPGVEDVVKMDVTMSLSLGAIVYPVDP